ncbi:MAG: hypothetical protein QT02_C0009G0003 [archaeon GW2011_AR9]|nr:MAG: hypothetical protein QT02_C0009G0003 [archaeon GW2011_AR9]
MAENKSTTERTSLGGLAGMLQSTLTGVPDRYYETTISGKESEQYVGTGSTPAEAERQASVNYKAGNEYKP